MGWLATAQRIAGETSSSADCRRLHEGTWIEHNRLPLPLPPHELFRRLLHALLGYGPYLAPDLAQLSSLAPGFPASDERKRSTNSKHVDGSTPEDTVIWHGLIVGVVLTDLNERNRGNPVSWPTSHQYTRKAFARLGASPSEAELARCIRSLSGEPLSIPEKQFVGPAGSILVMDHALHHGMAPNDGGVTRHMVYYRLPWRPTTRAADVVKPHFFVRSL